MLNILLPTDFSDNSWNAIVYALKLYKDEVCTFYLLNSTSLKASTMSSLSNKLLRTMREEAMKELLELKELADVADTNSNHSFEVILSSKHLQSAIKVAVKEKLIDLVIMATKGATGAKELLFGSNTVSAIQSLRHCPMLIVPQNYDYLEPTQLAFATDYKHAYSNKDLVPLKHLADLYNSKIRIVHINVEKELNSVQEYNFTMLKNYLNNHDYSFHWMPDYSKKVIEINDFIEELQINILAMVKYKHSLVENIFKESVVKKIGFNPRIPFLVQGKLTLLFLRS
ncbi:universal stress protein [Changchengzhania lutea]|uniref:universal stress protein n=1 Tax=Changchengzhania lutea TaxID=2049305 RepID=UPI00115F56BD|nr:universal stress protein [Changchengzhania lutea]